MYLKHTDASGNELGLFRSIKEASNRIGASVDVLSKVVKHKLELSDGTKLFKSALNNQERKNVNERKRLALQEWIRIKTHPNFLASKYHLQVQDVHRLIQRHKKELSVSAAHLEWLNTGGVVADIADRHDISAFSLAMRIRKGLRS